MKNTFCRKGKGNKILNGNVKGNGGGILIETDDTEIPRI